MSGSGTAPRRTIRVLVSVFAALMMVAYLSGPQPLRASAAPSHRQAAEQTTLQRDVDAIHAAGATGVLAAVLDHGSRTQARAGVARLGTTHNVPYDARFRIGSVTKTMLAAVILQLVGEGKLSLDDSVERWLPGVVDGNGYHGSEITIEMLLRMESGIADYTLDPRFQAPLDTVSGYHEYRFAHYEPRQLIDIALSTAPSFPPGTANDYSNTNYVILGQIIKAATGHTWSTEVNRRLLRPLGLAHTTEPGDRPAVPSPTLWGYNIYSEDPANRTYTETTLFNMSFIDSAGSLVSTTGDVNRFFTRLLSGHVLAPAQLAQMKQDSAVSPDQGLGMTHQLLDCGVDIWAHYGRVLGYNTYAIANEAGTRSVTVALPTTTFSEQIYYDDSEGAVGTLLYNVFCPNGASSPTASGVGSSQLVARLTS